MKTKITILLLFICSVGIGQNHVITVGKQDTVYYDPAHPNFVRKTGVVYRSVITQNINEIYLLKNSTDTIYGDALLNVPIDNTLSVTYICDICTDIGNDVKISSTSVGDYNMIYSGYQNNILSIKGTITIHVIDSIDESGPKNILMVGNSLVYNGNTYMADRLNDVFTEAAFIGSLGTIINHEGSPGKNWSWYASNEASPLVKLSKINIPAYLSDSSIAVPDYVIFRLGVNDCFGASDNTGDGLSTSDITAILGYAEALVDSFLALNDSTKVIIALNSISENTGAGWNDNYDESRYIQNDYIEATHKLWAAFVDTFTNYNYRVALSYDPIFVNRDEGYPKINGVHSNGVHPAELGYRQLMSGLIPVMEYLYNIPNGKVSELSVTTVSDTLINLAWTNTTTDATTVIERSTDNLTFTVIDTTAVAATSYPDSSCSPNTHYYYRVRNLKVDRYTPYSNIDDDYTAMRIPLTYTGTGVGVSTLTLQTTADVTMTINGTGKFYDNSLGTTNEGTSRTIIAGALRTFYLKVPSGTCDILIFHKNNITNIGNATTQGWLSGTDAASIQGMNLNDFARSITFLRVYGNNNISGTYSDWPQSGYYLGGSNTVTGYFTNLSSSLQIFYSNTANANINAITDLPTSLSFFYYSGANIITGNLSDAPVGVTYWYVQNTRINDYTAGRTWANGMNYLFHNPASGYGLSSSEVDNLLIDLAAATWTGSLRTLWVAGNNAARTSASDAAKAALQAQSVAVTVNE